MFASDGLQYIYFISDPPHLLKTTHNCWNSKHRNLWVNHQFLKKTVVMLIFQCNGKEIKWKHLESFYLQETQSSSAGLRMVPKLKYEHVYHSLKCGWI